MTEAERQQQILEGLPITEISEVEREAMCSEMRQQIPAYKEKVAELKAELEIESNLNTGAADSDKVIELKADIAEMEEEIAQREELLF